MSITIFHRTLRCTKKTPSAPINHSSHIRKSIHTYHTIRICGLIPPFRDILALHLCALKVRPVQDILVGARVAFKAVDAKRVRMKVARGRW